MRIFELANEIEGEITPLELVEKLKGYGFAVRNHMSSITDEEVVQFHAHIAKEKEVFEQAESSKKKTKKKLTKKKAAKKVTPKAVKKVTKKAAISAKASIEQNDDSEIETISTVKKKTVIRRKPGEKEAPKAEELESQEQTQSDVHKNEVDHEFATATASEEVEKVIGGLRVVKDAEKIEKELEGKTDAEKELYKEKTHKFTPVFIPEATKPKSTKPKEGETVAKKETSTKSESDTEKKEDETAATAKKRLGGLASMISGKKGVTRSQVLNETRSSSELRTYAALSTLGRPIYTQLKRKRIYSGPSDKTELTEVKEAKRVIQLHGGGSIKQIAKKLSIKVKDLIDKMLELNLLCRADDYIGMVLASHVTDLYGFRVENVKFNEDEVIGKVELSDSQKSSLPLRDPIIAIMGHVDHGKTTLLDFIRQSKVTEGEAGGITQHIGAYSVKVGSQNLTFLDTPGHAAFASMRQRGADVTDIVVLVVAADDGVMPQTKESVRFCQKAGVTLIIAVNKMDKEEANPDRIKNELTEFQITPEEWGGTTQFVPISALKGDGVDNLLEAIALQAEVLELRAEPKGNAEGVVIESKIEPGRGPVATVLIQSGTLNKGDSLVVGETYGRARGIIDTLGKQIKSAGPSVPVQILGLNSTPSPGDVLNIVKSEREAKKIVENRVSDKRALEVATPIKKVSLEDFFGAAAHEGVEQKSLNLIIRSDVQGSFEAIKQAILPLTNEEVEVKIIGGGVGPITDSDVQLADTADAIIIGFNMRPNTTARRLAEQKGIDVKTYSIIYELINEVTLALEGLLESAFEEIFIGRAEVKEPFTVPKIGTIAGSVVIDGSIKVGCNVRLLREGKIMFDGKMSSLKRFKDDVKEVKNGFECGVGLEGYNDIKTGDLFEAYILEERKRTLEDVASESVKAARMEDSALANV
jgi:translation initiation factor IF-2